MDIKQPRNIESNDPQIQLAYSHSTFDNIGLLCIVLELPIGILTTNPCGSAVYLGNGYLLTAAHCIEVTREETAISIADYSLLKPIGFIFRRINHDGTIHSEYTIQQIFTHPEYKSGLRGNDIALLKLTQPISDLAGLTPDFNTQPNSNFKQCTAIGFGMKGKRDGWFMSRDNIKRAIPVHDVFAVAYPDANYYCAVNGFCLRNTPAGNLFLEPTPHNPEAIGLTMGMSGGALVSTDGALLGIACGFFEPKNELFDSTIEGENPLTTDRFKIANWLHQQLFVFSTVLSYTTSLPVLGLNPITGLGNEWISIHSELIKNWVINIAPVFEPDQSSNATASKSTEDNEYFDQNSNCFSPFFHSSPEATEILYEVVTLYPFTALEEGDLSFQKGERLKIISSDENLYWATAQNEKGESGEIPLNYTSKLEPNLFKFS